MLLIFIFILAIIVVGLLSYISAEKDHHRLDNMRFGMIVATCVLAVITCATWGASYGQYVRLQEKLAIIEQYKETVELYADKGIREFQSGTFSSGEFTDLKYNNYQTQIGEMIRDMRDVIVSYNIKFTAKKVMKTNIFFSWLIYLPVDMKVVKMADYID